MIESTLAQARVQWITVKPLKIIFRTVQRKGKAPWIQCRSARRKIHEEPQFGQRVDDNFQWSIGSATSKAAVKVQGRTKDGRAG